MLDNSAVDIIVDVLRLLEGLEEGVLEGESVLKKDVGVLLKNDVVEDCVELKEVVGTGSSVED